jgi:hypothetical protein
MKASLYKTINTYDNDIDACMTILSNSSSSSSSSSSSISSSSNYSELTNCYHHYYYGSVLQAKACFIDYLDSSSNYSNSIVMLPYECDSDSTTYDDCINSAGLYTLGTTTTTFIIISITTTTIPFIITTNNNKTTTSGYAVLQ